MVGYLTREQSETVLLENSFGRIGCNDGFNTYIYPTNYIFAGKHLLLHALPGAKIDVMRDNKRVCLLVDEVYDLMNWKSIMVLGDFYELHDERDRYEAMKAFINHMLYLKVSETSFFSHNAGDENMTGVNDEKRPVIYRIVIDEITGRYEQEHLK